MIITDKRAIQNILNKHDARPKKLWGQNFLISRNALNKVVAAADLSPDDVVLEIGPGVGTLTVELAKRAKKVIAVEKDPKMCEILKNVLQDFDNIQIIQEDILTINPDKKFAEYLSHGINIKQIKVVANLPYYITAPVMRKFLEAEHPPQSMVLMVQKEVAQRICAAPPNMSLLAVSVQFYAQPKIISYVQKTAFWPMPKVDSAIIKITANSQQLTANSNKNLFFKIVKAGFAHPRKQIAGNLAGGLKINREKIQELLSKSSIKPGQRAETLTVGDWITLVNNYNSCE